MINTLPVEFTTKMERLLGREYAQFANSYLLPRSHGLRANTLKLPAQELSHLLPFSLTPVPWSTEGYYFDSECRPGKHPLHAAGLYYIQEPSAMAVVEVLDPQPGDKVLDLSAAPGGKATQIGARLKGRGLLVANEIVPNRAKILAENIERFGITNCLILNEHPRKLLPLFPGYFDKILVDAPCSGEGMFRKEPEVCAEWSIENVNRCAARQIEILELALEMLRPGGKLVYSTCTFSPEENEQVIEHILRTYPDVQTLPTPINKLLAEGKPGWAGGSPTLAYTNRLWPHLVRGEGHFIALLEKSSISPARSKKFNYKPLGPASKEALKLWQEFAAENLADLPPGGDYGQFAEYLYLIPEGLPDLGGIKVVRPGWLMGTAKKNRFEPGHALALGITSQQYRRCIDLPIEGPEVYSYLKGQTLNVNGEKGWTLVTVSGFPLGWGKHDGQTLKNHYPKGLRWF